MEKDGRPGRGRKVAKALNSQRYPIPDVFICQDEMMRGAAAPLIKWRVLRICIWGLRGLVFGA